MKSLIVLVVGLLSVGCLTPEQKQKTLRDSVVGEYEFTDEDGIYKKVYLENGVSEWYDRGKKGSEFKWSIVDGEIHLKYDSELIGVWRINADKSITEIAVRLVGNRTDLPKVNQRTYKRIK